ncbi:S1C family serine protease [Terricaulis sp.]|uniref:S1C family serine protease n=1 Tax=Terricaulis sp. TaxID=2768686 RepID=UPI00378338F9
MRKSVLALLAVATLGLAACDRIAPQRSGGGETTVTEAGTRTVTPRGALSDSEQSTVSLFANAAPSVVQVVGRTQTSIGAGSGFVWDQQGHVVTNNHVVEAQEIMVRLANGDALRAEVIGRAPQYDIAVLRLERAPGVPPLAIGSSSDLRVGQSVFAIGNPFGLDQSLSSGIVSALQRRLPTPQGREIADVIQTDAAINPGNSGGPLLDSAARVIGVNTAIFSPTGVNSGIGFAIPIDTVARVVPDLIANGRTPTAGIGILVADEAVATRLGVEGVLIWETSPGGPAARAGLRGTNPQAGVLGDVIVEANGHPVARLADLTNEFERVGVGRTITLVIERGKGNRSQVQVPVQDIGD